eukprot:COSAG01_NODE_39209_length_479_cov_1.628947_2_plen_24_part_01
MNISVMHLAMKRQALSANNLAQPV